MIFVNHAPPQTYVTDALRLQATYERLCWRYGSAKALRIINGEDEASNEDVARWRRFGGLAPRRVRP